MIFDFINARYANIEGGIMLTSADGNELYVDSCEYYSKAIDGDYGAIAGYIEPVISPEVILATAVQDINLAVQVHLAAIIKSYKFTNEINYAKYVGYPNEFRVIAESLGAYESKVWVYCEGEIVKLEAGTRTAPTPEAFISELPVWIEPL